MFYFTPSPPSEVKENLITISYDTNYDITKIEITNNGIDFIEANSFTSTSAIFDISLWSNATYTNCYLRVTHNVYASVVVSEESLSLSENESKVMLISLSEKPTNNQVVTVSLGNEALASINKTKFTFTPTNWNVPQELIVTAKHRVDIFKNESTKVRFDTPYYDRLSIPVNITNIDVPVWGNIVPSINMIEVNEGASTALTVTLDKQPSLSQTFNVYVGNTSVASAMPSKITFNKDNWSIPQTITITGIHDKESLVNKNANLNFVNDNVEIKKVPITLVNIDREKFGSITPSVTNISVAENEASNFTVVLSQAPTYDQLVTIESENIDILTVKPSQITFNKDNWNVPQIVTIKGIYDSESKEDKLCAITLSNKNVKSKVINTTIANIDGKTISLSIPSSEMIAGAKLETDGSVGTSTGVGRYVTDYVPLNGLEKIVANVNKGVLRRICLYDTNYNFIKELSLTNSNSFEYLVTEEDFAYIRFYIQEGDATTVLSVVISDPNIQIEPDIPIEQDDIVVRYSDLIADSKLEGDGTIITQSSKWVTDYLDISKTESINVVLSGFTLRRIVEFNENREALSNLVYNYITDEVILLTG